MMTLKRTVRLMLGVIAMPMALHAANPFLPSYEYIPDGSPRVFGDRVYLYGSHDKAGSQRFCDYILKVWSAPLTNLNAWTDHGIMLSTRDVDGHQRDYTNSNQCRTVAVRRETFGRDFPKETRGVSESEFKSF
jgi:hypothetical protein